MFKIFFLGTPRGHNNIWEALPPVAMFLISYERNSLYTGLLITWSVMSKTVLKRNQSCIVV